MRPPRPLVAAGLLVAVPAGASAAAPLPPARPLTPQEVAQIQAQMATQPFNQGIWGMLVQDVATGPTLDSHGRVSPTGTLNGRLALVASGDLTMGGRALRNGDVAYSGFDHMDANEVPGPATLTPQDPLAGLDSLAQQVRRSGVRRVSGDVVVDDRLWKARTVGHEVVSPIVINDNVIDITMRPRAVGRIVRVSTRPATAAYDIDMRVKTVPKGAETHVVVGPAHGRKVTVTGTLAASTAPFVQIFRVPRP
jgi:D-alanyl-D-alanine carboxypeptidase/D-alanyl-D-alanine-endopeptidase (penicillin-binding protein 4)